MPNYTGAIVAGGIGVLGLTVGAVGKWLASSKAQDARRLCSQREDACPPSPQDDRDAWKRYAHTARQVGDVAFGVGAAGLVAGGVLFFLAQGKEQKSSAVGVTPSLGMDRLGVNFSGSF